MRMKIVEDNSCSNCKWCKEPNTEFAKCENPVFFKLNKGTGRFESSITYCEVHRLYHWGWVARNIFRFKQSCGSNGWAFEAKDGE